MCFNVYVKNKDDYGENFAFIYGEEIGKYTLSPSYDLTPVPNKMEHEMTVNGNGNPTDYDILAVARKIYLNETKCLDIMKNIKNII